MCLKMLSDCQNPTQAVSSVFPLNFFFMAKLGSILNNPTRPISLKNKKRMRINAEFWLGGWVIHTYV
jgi:hypothetical protein